MSAKWSSMSSSWPAKRSVSSAVRSSRARRAGDLGDHLRRQGGVGRVGHSGKATHDSSASWLRVPGRPRRSLGMNRLNEQVLYSTPQPGAATHNR